MARDVPIGNGQMLVCFDQDYQVRDLYYPHVGQENHCGATPCRFGVYADLPEPGPDRRRRRLYWSSDGWDIHLDYMHETMATSVRMEHSALKLQLYCNDVVDFHRPLLVRRIELTNLCRHARQVRLVHHNNFNMYGSKVGDTAYYDPQLRALVHFRGQRYLMSTWYANGEQRVDEYATGNAGFLNAEGTWRDAEDGTLGNNPIAQGSVDATMLLSLQLPPGATQTAYLVLGAGHNREDIAQLQRFLHRDGPQAVIDRTIAYWKLWLDAANPRLTDLAGSGPSERVSRLGRRSLLIVRTQIDNSGAIIAANDSDYLQYSRDTYSYLWPRDGALVAAALDEVGYSDIARSFYALCSRIIEPGGYFLHKYNPDGSPASSWHPWVSQGRPQLPIQEDETALVVWALWRHFQLYRDIEFVRPLWLRLIQPAADFMLQFRDPATRLPLPTYDLWEERWGVHAFTVATVYGGLMAAWNFASCFGDAHRARHYLQAATAMQQAFCRHFWCEDEGRFLRRIVPLDHDRTAALMAPLMARQGHETEAAAPPSRPSAALDEDAVAFEYDRDVDASLWGLFAMGMFDADDPRIEATMQAVERRLWVRTGVGGLARYERDGYLRMSDDVQRVPGNPWFICTLWLAQWYIARARTASQLEAALPILEWVADHALPSGALPEQLHPYSGAPMSVSPLTWSHATLVATLSAYTRRSQAMQTCPTCGRHRPERRPAAHNLPALRQTACPAA